MMMSPYGNASMPGMGAAPGQQQDFPKLFKAEKDNLALADGLYKWAGADVELRVLRKYGRIPDSPADDGSTHVGTKGKKIR
jgi:hypothetical protein